MRAIADRADNYLILPSRRVETFVFEGALDLAHDAAVRRGLAEGASNSWMDEVSGHRSITWSTRRLQ